MAKVNNELRDIQNRPFTSFITEPARLNRPFTSFITEPAKLNRPFTSFITEPAKLNHRPFTSFITEPEKTTGIIKSDHHKKNLKKKSDVGFAKNDIIKQKKDGNMKENQWFKKVNTNCSTKCLDEKKVKDQVGFTRKNVSEVKGCRNTSQKMKVVYTRRDDDDSTVENSSHELEALRFVYKETQRTDDVYEPVEMDKPIQQQLRSLNQGARFSRVEKLMKDLKRETDTEEALSELISRRFKEVLNVNDERVDEIVRQVKAEAHLQRKQALDHVKKKPSASSCSIM